MKKKKTNYVDNEKLYEEYVIWKAQLKEDPEKQMPRFIAESIMEICNRMSYSPSYINYSYRDEMVLDAIEACVKAAPYFDPEKGKNPFNYLSTVTYYAFLHRLAKEKKQSKVKAVIIQKMPVEDLLDVQEHDEDSLMMQTQYIEFLRENSYIGSDVEGKPGNSVDGDEGIF